VRIRPKPWRCLAPKIFLKRAASMGGYMESFVADAFGVGRVNAAKPYCASISLYAVAGARSWTRNITADR